MQYLLTALHLVSTTTRLLLFIILAHTVQVHVGGAQTWRGREKKRGREKNFSCLVLVVASRPVQHLSLYTLICRIMWSESRNKNDEITSWCFCFFHQVLTH